ncbi:MAG: NfeD family protein [Candidatus Wallbacteria bacterium]|nr:NfeD family protein [Candidatus Wallbacteria bacterium]
MHLPGGIYFEPWLVWVLVGIAFIIFEMLTMATGFVMLCFGVGAVFTGLLAFLGVSFKFQLLAFSLITLIVLATFRDVYLKLISKKTDSYVSNVGGLIGREATVTEDIDNKNGIGRARVGGELWAARSENDSIVKAGMLVTVKQVDGNKVIVALKESK